MTFHVPEHWRIRSGPMASNETFGNNGCFLIPNLNPMSSLKLRVIATDEFGWEHVSVALPSRVPNWDEMCYVKGLFWGSEDCVMQLHPPGDQYVNYHPFCLHLWRPIMAEIPQPPFWMVGPPRGGETSGGGIQLN